MKKILRKIALMCSVLLIASVIFIFAATITALKICYSNDYLLEMVGVVPEKTYQSTVVNGDLKLKYPVATPSNREHSGQS